MKVFIWMPAIALLCLAVPFGASGQDAPSATFRGESKPTPEASPTQTPAAESTPKPKEKRPRKAEERPAAETKETPAAKAEKKSAPKAPAKPDVDRPAENGAGTVRKLRQLESEWEASPHDVATIEKMVADDFIGVTSGGKIVSKRTMIKEARKKKSDATSSAGHLDVRLHGAQVAVVVGTATESGKNETGKKWTSTYRFTDTWMERGGKWQCIASQATTLPGR